MTQGRPGFISDPVIDTSKRQIIYAHCVASNRAFGPDRRGQSVPDPDALGRSPGRVAAFDAAHSAT